MGEFDYSKLPEDLGLRPNILSYPPNVRDQVRRYYLMKGPCQPKNHNFPLMKKGNDHARKFNLCWFMDHASCLEYNIAKDRLFCLQCYIFKSGGADNFVNEGYYGWKKKDRLQKHVGHYESFHNVAKGKCNDLLNQEQHIEATFSKQSDESRRQYQIRLGASIQTVKFLLRQGLAFRGDDESEDSTNNGNFLELLQWLGKNNKKEIQPYILENAQKNLQLKSPKIQKDIANAISYEIISAIVSDIGDSCFSILVDESKDVSNKEQMVYKLLTLALILPVATASVERLFSAMKILKNRLRNRMGDEWMNDCLLAYVERDILDNITDDMIMRRFQNMKTRRGRLPLNMETS